MHSGQYMIEDLVHQAQACFQYKYRQGYPHRLTHNRPSNVHFHICATGFSLAALQICAFLAQVSPGGSHDLQGVSMV